MRHHRFVVTTTAAVAAGLLMMSTGCSDDGADAGVAAIEPPAKVTVTGDSIAFGLGGQMREAFPDDVEVTVIAQPGTGLARADVFDWPRRLEELARDFPPEVLIFSLGSNDAQDLVDPDGDVVTAMSERADWDAEYSARMARAMDAFEGSGTTVVWVGHVRTAEARVGLVNRRVHELAVEVAATRDWVVVEDFAEILGSGEDVATDCLIPDGLHLSVDCLDQAAVYFANSLT